MPAIIQPLNGPILTQSVLTRSIEEELKKREIILNMPHLEYDEIPLLSFRNPYDQNDPIRPLLFKKELLVFAGKPKARKSFFARMAACAFYVNSPMARPDLTAGIYCTASDKPFGIWFDTEMVDREVYKRSKSGFTTWLKDESLTSHLKTYYLRGATVEAKLDMIEAATAKWYEQNGYVTYIVIDQSMDLIGEDSFVESNRIMSRLHDIQEKYECAIIATIHTTGTSTKPYGHWGTTLTKKAECVIIVDIDETTGISKAKPSLVRGSGDPWSIEFAQNQDGPVVWDIESNVRDFSSQSLANRFGNVVSNDVSLQQQGADDDFPF